MMNRRRRRIIEQKDLSNQEIIYLSQAEKNRKVKVMNVENCGEPGKRLCELGFMCSSSCMVLRNDKRHPVLLEIDGSAFAIGRGLASKIVIKYED